MINALSELIRAIADLINAIMDGLSGFLSSQIGGSLITGLFSLFAVYLAFRLENERRDGKERETAKIYYVPVFTEKIRTSTKLFDDVYETASKLKIIDEPSGAFAPERIRDFAGYDRLALEMGELIKRYSEDLNFTKIFDERTLTFFTNLKKSLKRKILKIVIKWNLIENNIKNQNIKLEKTIDTYKKELSENGLAEILNQTDAAGISNFYLYNTIFLLSEIHKLIIFEFKILRKIDKKSFNMYTDTYNLKLLDLKMTELNEQFHKINEFQEKHSRSDVKIEKSKIKKITHNISKGTRSLVRKGIASMNEGLDDLFDRDLTRMTKRYAEAERVNKELINQFQKRYRDEIKKTRKPRPEAGQSGD